MASWSKDLVRAFINDYKGEEVLWRLKHPDYSIREVKRDAYDRMVDKYRHLDPSIDREMITKKINSLRTCCRKEQRRIFQCIEAGKNPAPRLFYFNDMNFVFTQEGAKGVEFKSNKGWNPRRQAHDVNTEDWEEVSMVAAPDDMTLECYDDSNASGHFSADEVNDENALDETHNMSDASEGQSQGRTEDTEGCSSTTTQMYRDNHSHSRRRSQQQTRCVYRQKRKRDRSSRGHFDDEHENVVIADAVTDCNSAFGANVAAKLRLMERKQRIFTERLINEALFYGELGHLNIQSRIVVVENEHENNKSDTSEGRNQSQSQGQAEVKTDLTRDV